SARADSPPPRPYLVSPLLQPFNDGALARGHLAVERHWRSVGIRRRILRLLRWTAAAGRLSRRRRIALADRAGRLGEIEHLLRPGRRPARHRRARRRGLRIGAVRRAGGAGDIGRLVVAKNPSDVAQGVAAIEHEPKRLERE